MEKVKVKFLKSPTGAYNLGYNADDIAEVDKELADAMVKAKFAIVVSETEASANNEDEGSAEAETAESKKANTRQKRTTAK